MNNNTFTNDMRETCFVCVLESAGQWRQKRQLDKWTHWTPVRYCTIIMLSSSHMHSPRSMTSHPVRLPAHQFLGFDPEAVQRCILRSLRIERLKPNSHRCVYRKLQVIQFKSHSDGCLHVVLCCFPSPLLDSLPYLV